MGLPRSLEKTREANKIKTACKDVYNIISYRWIDIWNQSLGVFCSKSLKMDVKKADFSFFWILGFKKISYYKMEFFQKGWKQF